jgi:hypothetical protein
VPIVTLAGRMVAERIEADWGALRRRAVRAARASPVAPLSST